MRECVVYILAHPSALYSVHLFPASEPRRDVRLAKVDRVNKEEARYNRPFESVIGCGQLRHAEKGTAEKRLARLDGASYRLFSVPRVATRNMHGTGCTLSSAIAAFCAQGFELGEAIGAAKT